LTKRLQDPWSNSGRELILARYGNQDDPEDRVQVVCMRLREELEEWLDQRTRWIYCFEYSWHECEDSQDPVAWPQGVYIAIWDPEMAVLFKLTWA
jgi:hypothetical protein